MTDVVETLKGVPLFTGVGDRELRRLAKVMRESRFNEGETVTTEGRSGIGFFVIEHGKIALIDEGPRSATITATTDLSCRGMAAWEFRSFVQEHPEVAWPLLETLASRLRDAEERGA